MSIGFGRNERPLHYGTPKRDPSRRRMPLAKRRHGPKSMPPGYHAQTVPLKHMHSFARIHAPAGVAHETLNLGHMEARR